MKKFLIRTTIFLLATIILFAVSVNAQSTCPLSDWQTRSNEELIGNCSHQELAQLPNERLMTFPLDVLEVFPNERLDDFSLDFLANFRNERLLQFSNNFLINFPNDVLLRFPNTRLATFPQSRILTFPCDRRVQLGFPCTADTATPTPGGGQQTPTPGGSGGGPAEGSECQYEILDPTTLQRASRIETQKDYTVKLTMINKAAQDSGLVWKQGQYKLTSTPQTQATWGTKAAYELAESQQGQDVRPGGSLLFHIPIKAPAIGQNPESKSFYFVMAKDGVAFGAACQPQDVIVHPPAKEPVSTLCYAISENSIEVSSVSSCDLTNPTIHPYTDNPIAYSFRDTTPGLKTIYVKFFDNNNRPSNIFTKNVLLSPDPSITNADCRHLATGVGTQITITGTNFGVQQGRGKVKVSGTDVLPTTWTSNTITLSLDQRLEGDVPLVVTIDDGREATGTCIVNTTSFTFTAKNQCRLPGQFSLDNVEVKIFELGTEPILKQTTKLDKDGKPQGFTPKLEKNKNYTMVIKAPGVLAKKVNVSATGGTVNVEPFTLLSGDIYPRGSSDGKVNALDTSELKREWSLVTDVVRDGDLNGDSRVNSIDYSCMLQNINKEDEIFTPPVITTPTPSLTPTPQPTPTT